MIRLTLAVSLTIVLSACPSPPGEKAPATETQIPERKLQVKTAKAVSKTVSTYFQATGSFIAEESSDVAPANGGRVAVTPAEVGDFVKRGDPVATYVDNREIIVSANVSEFDAQAVRVGSDAEARLATGEVVRGRIRYVAPVADEATRTFTVELEVDNTDGALRAGGTAELRIPAGVVLAHRNVMLDLIFN